jgi:MFS family permease
MSQAAAGLLLVAVSLAATVSRVGVGMVADRRGQEPLRPVATMLAVSIAGYLLLMAAEPALIVVAALLAGFFGWAWPGGLTLAVVQRSPGAPAWAVGVLMAGLFSGAIAGPLLVGLLAEHERSRSPGAPARGSRCSRPARCWRFGRQPYHAGRDVPVRFLSCATRSFIWTPAESGLGRRSGRALPASR